MNNRVTIPIRSAFDAITARVKVREFAREKGLDITGQARISLAAYSLANASDFGNKNQSQNQIIVNKIEKGKRVGVEVICVIQDAANSHFAETLENIRWLVDEFTIDTLSSSETQVVLVQWSLPPQGRFQ